MIQNAYGLPTQTIYALFGKLSQELTHAQRNNYGKVFQRACMVGDLDSAIDILKIHLDFELTEDDLAKLKLAHIMAKPEVLGIAVETLTEITQSPLSAQKDKVLATQALNDLYGDKDRINDKGLTDKIILNLMGN